MLFLIGYTSLNQEHALSAGDKLGPDPDRMARFEREARLLVSLDHPNIGAIYGLEEGNGTRSLVLALIEGPTLADRIAAARSRSKSDSDRETQADVLWTVSRWLRSPRSSC